MIPIHESRSDFSVGTCLVQFAKAPRLGSVKTRMTPALSDVEALCLHSSLIVATYSNLAQGSWDYQLWLSDVGYDDELKGLLGDPQVSLSVQSGGDLGERMSRCFQVLLESYDKVILVGSDCPFLERRDILEVQKLLDSHSCVLKPAIDGGYALIGLRRHSSKLFQNITWGGSAVLTQTLAALEALHWSYACVEPVSDIDVIDDLRALVRSDEGRAALGKHYQRFHDIVIPL